VDQEPLQPEQTPNRRRTVPSSRSWRNASDSPASTPCS
jgi:hypothetical protein